MSEMIERVSKAIRTYGVRMYGAPHKYVVIGADFDQPLTRLMDAVEAYDEAAKMNARAAIEAMREPTEEMEVAGTERWLCEAAMEDRSGANWRAMIDEALR